MRVILNAPTVHKNIQCAEIPQKMSLKTDRTHQQKWPMSAKNSKKLDTANDTETSQPKAIKPKQKKQMSQDKGQKRQKQQKKTGRCEINRH